MLCVCRRAPLTEEALSWLRLVTSQMFCMSLSKGQDTRMESLSCNNYIGLMRSHTTHLHNIEDLFRWQLF